MGRIIDYVKDKGKRSLYALFVLSFLLAAFFIMNFTLDQYKKRHLNGVVANLELDLNATNKLLHDWIDNRIFDINSWLQMPEIREPILNIIKGNARDENIIRLNKLLLPILKHRADQGYFIINRNFISIASSRKENTGTRNLIAYDYPRRLERVFDGESLAIPPINSDVPLPHKKDGMRKVPTMFIATPIKDNKGEVLAVFTVRMNPQHAFYKLATYQGAIKGQSTYFFDRNGILLIPSRYEEQVEVLVKAGVLKGSNVLDIKLLDPGVDLVKGEKPKLRHELWPYTYMAQRAIREEEAKNSEGYRDFRGVKVVGAWSWNAIAGFAVAAEVDYDVAMASFRDVRTLTKAVFYSLTFLSLILIISILFIEGRSQKEILDAKNNAEEANLLKDKFLSLIAHDLKSPIGVIAGYSEILMEDNLNSSERKDLLLRIDEMSTKMNEMIDGLLGLARIKMGKFELNVAQYDLYQIIEEIFDEMHFFADRKKIKLINEVEEDSYILCDRKLFSELFKNLTSNAIKFCNKRDSITISFDPIDLQIFVVDTGKGIDPSRIDDLFDYTKKTSTNGTSGEIGTGLGLPLCHDIVVAHEGTIKVHSAGVGQGTTFIITLKRS